MWKPPNALWLVIVGCIMSYQNHSHRHTHFYLLNMVYCGCMVCVCQSSKLITTVEPELKVNCINQISIKVRKESPKWSQYITGSLHKQVTQCTTARKYCPKGDRYIQVLLYKCIFHNINIILICNVPIFNFSNMHDVLL